jgi:hypothetical protein
MRRFCLGEKLRPVSSAPRDDTSDTHHSAASYPQQHPCTRLEAQSQDRQVRSRARVSKTELRGRLTGRPGSAPEHRGRHFQPQPQPRARGSVRRDLSGHCRAQSRSRPRWPWQSMWSWGTESLHWAAGPRARRGARGAQCDHSKPWAEGLKRPVLAARSSPQACLRLRTAATA